MKLLHPIFPFLQDFILKLHPTYRYTVISFAMAESGFGYASFISAKPCLQYKKLIAFT
jgi:hypothetical protein